MPEHPNSVGTEELHPAEIFLDEWLATDWDSSEWQDLFTGVGVSGAPPGEEPYEWILEGLPGSRQEKRQEELVGRLADVLSLKPDQGEFDQVRSQALFNVLALCSELPARKTLAAPLMEIMNGEPALPMESHGYQLRRALAQALIMNPPGHCGRDLEERWVDMALGRDDGFFPRVWSDIVNGVLFLPIDNCWERPTDSICAILGALADELGEAEEAEFRVFVERVWRDWGEDSIRELLGPSFARAWPYWAKKCLMTQWPAADNQKEWVEDIAEDQEKDRDPTGAIDPGVSEAYATQVSSGIADLMEADI